MGSAAVCLVGGGGVAAVEEGWWALLPVSSLRRWGSKACCFRGSCVLVLTLALKGGTIPIPSRVTFIAAGCTVADRRVVAVRSPMKSPACATDVLWDCAFISDMIPTVTFEATDGLPFALGGEN